MPLKRMLITCSLFSHYPPNITDIGQVSVTGMVL